jgi:hypothetical protein
LQSMQDVRMKGIQNKTFISLNLILIHVSGLWHRKGQLWKFFHARLTRMRQLVTWRAQ